MWFFGQNNLKFLCFFWLSFKFSKIIGKKIPIYFQRIALPVNACMKQVEAVL